MDCGNDGDGEFPNVIVDADGEHNSDEAASDVHVIDADGVFHNERGCAQSDTYQWL